MNEIKKKDTGMLIGDKYLLSIKEAGEYFNIGTKKMRQRKCAVLQRIISALFLCSAETDTS